MKSSSARQLSEVVRPAFFLARLLLVAGLLMVGARQTASAALWGTMGQVAVAWTR